jgi:hypothetical protein
VMYMHVSNRLLQTKFDFETVDLSQVMSALRMSHAMPQHAVPPASPRCTKALPLCC